MDRWLVGGMMNRDSPIRVMVVTGVRLYAEGLRAVLGSSSELEVVGLAADPAEAEERIDELSPDVVLMDPGAPDAEHLVGRVFHGSARAKVVMLGLARVEEQAVRWAQCGAHGFVTRENSLDELVSVVRSVARGRFRCSPQVATALMRELARQSAGRVSTQDSPHLTRREHEVSGLLARGLSNKGIARRLGIAVSTVKNHVHNILTKLDLQRRGQVAQWLRRHGIGPVRSRRPDRPRTSGDADSTT